MAKNRQILAVNGFDMTAVKFENADGTSAKTLITNASAEGIIVKSINISSTDTSAQVMSLYVGDGVTDHFIGVLPIAIGAGTLNTGATPSVKGLDETKIKGLEKDIQGNYILKLKGGWTLKAAMVAAVTAAKVISVLSSYEIITADA